MHRAAPKRGLPGYCESHHSSGVPVYMQSILRFLNEEDGQDVVEYGLLIATIAIVVLIGVGIFGNNINAWFKGLAGRITTTGT
jgi:pilus assembly protein Flp/PilA